MTKRDEEYLRCIMKAWKLAPRNAYEEHAKERDALRLLFGQACRRLHLYNEQADVINAEAVVELMRKGLLYE